MPKLPAADYTIIMSRYLMGGAWRMPRPEYRLVVESRGMPRKIRQLVDDLLQHGFLEIAGGGKGSHRKFVHCRFAGAVTLSGKPGDDAKPYQERQIRRVLEAIDENH